MKTAVIHLEPHDDLISIQDKLSWSKAPRIILIWPAKGKVLRNRLEMVLMGRYSQKLGAQIGLVTQNQEVVNHASDVGISVFKSSTTANQQTWKRVRRKKRIIDITRRKFNEIFKQFSDHRLAAVKKEPEWSRVISFSLAWVSFFALIFFLLPGATVDLDLSSYRQSTQFTLLASPDDKYANIPGKVPAGSIRVEVEGKDYSTTTGSVIVPNEYAKGLVRVVNISPSPVTIPENTILITENNPSIRYKTLSATFLAPGQKQAVNLSIQAILPGLSGNLAPNQVFSIEGIIGVDLLVSNTEPIMGGSESVQKAPSVLDVGQLKNRLLNNLAQTALVEAEHKLTKDQMLIKPSIKLINTMNEKQQPENGQPGNQLFLELHVEFEVWFVQLKDIKQTAKVTLDASLKEGAIADPESVGVLFTKDPIIKDGVALWEVEVNRNYYDPINREMIASSIAGKSISEASNLLNSSNKLISPPKITLYPSWWPRLPFWPLRIYIEPGN